MDWGTNLTQNKNEKKSYLPKGRLKKKISPFVDSKEK